MLFSGIFLLFLLLLCRVHPVGMNCCVILFFSGVNLHILYIKMETPRDRSDQQPPKQTTLVYICGGWHLSGFYLFSYEFCCLLLLQKSLSVVPWAQCPLTYFMGSISFCVSPVPTGCRYPCCTSPLGRLLLVFVHFAIHDIWLR